MRDYPAGFFNVQPKRSRLLLLFIVKVTSKRKLNSKDNRFVVPPVRKLLLYGKTAKIFGEVYRDEHG